MTENYKESYDKWCEKCNHCVPYLFAIYEVMLTSPYWSFPCLTTTSLSLDYSLNGGSPSVHMQSDIQAGGALYKLMLRVAKKGVWMEPPTWDLQSSCKIQTCGTEA
ncbi:uncharacterized protein TRIVIDRAFT_60884 [Trichoderma virens Gv29-8]|uniref:Uncharacterized protein n=1 Tax=Hypocrea virens (strain Gv29-8 / FGSC 10586) TaxID=413071 RepID=G9MSZ0_HYPVG|nr:uncharacterized protein TRIVIDRAFT_60884 [Trichoderma virens Gv29-8]EHK22246.1 hypothetical protein TRIVIDRAFT_60884 [Trichoderma virens Gv29-8]